MYDFIKRMFNEGKINAEKVQSYVPIFITQAQADEIMGGKK